ncbi:superoxide dismutase family protein [Azospirillum halopraeferens]|uniref:superoxide dismutase family protein n=1 Tax=Azospirillum halopraeferens TaxID=34010 RepID=UPI000412F1A6|nr:superoxide dismutase family protein [Azospirillum halopraeferens]
MRHALFATALLLCPALASGAAAQATMQGQGPSIPGPLPEAPAGQAFATAELAGPDGARLGTAAFVETPAGVLIQIRLQNVPPGMHGLHIHERGACEPPDFRSAGGHYNPDGRAHGYMAPGGVHAGDLPNLFAASNGEAGADILTDRVSLGTGANTLFPEGGTALVLHSGPDDYRTDPAGASGDRIACGVILRTTQP